MSYAGIINSEGNSCLHHPGGEIWTIGLLKREPGQRTNIERIRTARRIIDVYILHLFHQCRRACRPACKIFRMTVRRHLMLFGRRSLREGMEDNKKEHQHLCTVSSFLHIPFSLRHFLSSSLPDFQVCACR